MAAIIMEAIILIMVMPLITNLPMALLMVDIKQVGIIKVMVILNPNIMVCTLINLPAMLTIITTGNKIMADIIQTMVIINHNIIITLPHNTMAAIP